MAVRSTVRPTRHDERSNPTSPFAVYAVPWHLDAPSAARSSQDPDPDGSRDTTDAEAHFLPASTLWRLVSRVRAGSIAQQFESASPRTSPEIPFANPGPESGTERETDDHPSSQPRRTQHRRIQHGFSGTAGGHASNPRPQRGDRHSTAPTHAHRSRPLAIARDAGVDRHRRHPGLRSFPAQPGEPRRLAAVFVGHHGRVDPDLPGAAVDVDDPVRVERPAGVQRAPGPGDPGPRSIRRQGWPGEPAREVAPAPGRPPCDGRCVRHDLRRGHRRDPNDRDRGARDARRAPHLGAR